MTKEELDELCSALEANGYKRWTICLSSNENFGYFKSVKENGEILYQIEFRIWDYSKYGRIDSYGVDIAVKSSTNDNRNDMVLSYPRNIEDVEKMASGFYELTKKYK